MIIVAGFCLVLGATRLLKLGPVETLLALASYTVSAMFCVGFAVGGLL